MTTFQNMTHAELMIKALQINPILTTVINETFIIAIIQQLVKIENQDNSNEALVSDEFLYLCLNPENVK